MELFPVVQAWVYLGTVVPSGRDYLWPEGALQGGARTNCDTPRVELRNIQYRGVPWVCVPGNKVHTHHTLQLHCRTCT